MKKKILCSISLIVIAIFAVFLSACKKDLESFTIDFPDAYEGYDVYITGSYSVKDESNKTYSVYAGQSITFEIVPKTGYTLQNMVVKANDEVMEYTDLSYEHYTRYSFSLQDINKEYIITITGVEMLKFNVKMQSVKYKNGPEDTEGTLFTDIDTSILKVRHENDTYNNLQQAINSINNKNLKMNHGDTLELWIGEAAPNYFRSGSFFLFNGKEGFNGIFGEKSGNTYTAYNAVPNAQMIFPKKDSEGNYIKQDNMYKFEIQVKEDLNLYFNTLMLEKERYSVSYIPTEVYRITSTYDSIYFDTQWYFNIEKCFIDDYPAMYDNMKVFINGEDITEHILDGTYTSVYRVPSEFNRGINTNYKDFVITVEGIDLEANGDIEVTMIKVLPNEALSYIAYETNSSSQRPYYYQNNEYYFLKTEEYIEVYFWKQSLYDYSEIEIDINGIKLSNSNNASGNLTYFENKNRHNDSSNYFAIKITGDYDDNYVIEVTGITYKKLAYTIKNDLASQVDLFIEINGSRQKITSQQSYQLIHGDTFTLELVRKNEVNINDFTLSGLSNIYNITKSEINYDENGYATDISFTIKVNAETDSEGRNVNVSSS